MAESVLIKVKRQVVKRENKLKKNKQNKTICYLPPEDGVTMQDWE